MDGEKIKTLLQPITPNTSEKEILTNCSDLREYARRLQLEQDKKNQQIEVLKAHLQALQEEQVKLRLTIKQQLQQIQFLENWNDSKKDDIESEAISEIRGQLEKQALESVSLGNQLQDCRIQIQERNIQTSQREISDREERERLQGEATTHRLMCTARTRIIQQLESESSTQQKVFKEKDEQIQNLEQKIIALEKEQKDSEDKVKRAYDSVLADMNIKGKELQQKERLVSALNNENALLKKNTDDMKRDMEENMQMKIVLLERENKDKEQKLKDFQQIIQQSSQKENKDYGNIQTQTSSEYKGSLEQKLKGLQSQFNRQQVHYNSLIQTKDKEIGILTQDRSFLNTQLTKARTRSPSHLNTPSRLYTPQTNKRCEDLKDRLKEKESHLNGLRADHHKAKEHLLKAQKQAMQLEGTINKLYRNQDQLDKDNRGKDSKIQALEYMLKDRLRLDTPQLHREVQGTDSIRDSSVSKQISRVTPELKNTSSRRDIGPSMDVKSHQIPADSLYNSVSTNSIIDDFKTDVRQATHTTNSQAVKTPRTFSSSKHGYHKADSDIVLFDDNNSVKVDKNKTLANNHRYHHDYNDIEQTTSDVQISHQNGKARVEANVKPETKNLQGLLHEITSIIQNHLANSSNNNQAEHNSFYNYLKDSPMKQTQSIHKHGNNYNNSSRKSKQINKGEQINRVMNLLVQSVSNYQQDTLQPQSNENKIENKLEYSPNKNLVKPDQVLQDQLSQIQSLFKTVGAQAGEKILIQQLPPLERQEQSKGQNCFDSSQNEFHSYLKDSPAKSKKETAGGQYLIPQSNKMYQANNPKAMSTEEEKRKTPQNQKQGSLDVQNYVIQELQKIFQNVSAQNATPQKYANSSIIAQPSKTSQQNQKTQQQLKPQENQSLAKSKMDTTPEKITQPRQLPRESVEAPQKVHVKKRYSSSNQSIFLREKQSIKDQNKVISHNPKQTNPSQKYIGVVNSSKQLTQEQKNIRTQNDPLIKRPQDQQQDLSNLYGKPPQKQLKQQDDGHSNDQRYQSLSQVDKSPLRLQRSSQELHIQKQKKDQLPHSVQLSSGTESLSLPKENEVYDSQQPTQDANRVSVYNNLLSEAERGSSSSSQSIEDNYLQNYHTYNSYRQGLNKNLSLPNTDANTYNSNQQDKKNKLHINKQLNKIEDKKQWTNLANRTLLRPSDKDQRHPKLIPNQQTYSASDLQQDNVRKEPKIRDKNLRKQESDQRNLLKEFHREHQKPRKKDKRSGQQDLARKILQDNDGKINLSDSNGSQRSGLSSLPSTPRSTNQIIDNVDQQLAQQGIQNIEAPSFMQPHINPKPDLQGKQNRLHGEQQVPLLKEYHSNPKMVGQQRRVEKAFDHTLHRQSFSTGQIKLGQKIYQDNNLGGNKQESRGLRPEHHAYMLYDSTEKFRNQTKLDLANKQNTPAENDQGKIFNTTQNTRRNLQQDFVKSGLDNRQQQASHDRNWSDSGLTHNSNQGVLRQIQPRNQHPKPQQMKHQSLYKDHYGSEQRAIPSGSNSNLLQNKINKYQNQNLPYQQRSSLGLQYTEQPLGHSQRSVHSIQQNSKKDYQPLNQLHDTAYQSPYEQGWRSYEQNSRGANLKTQDCGYRQTNKLRSHKNNGEQTFQIQTSNYLDNSQDSLDLFQGVNLSNRNSNYENQVNSKQFQNFQKAESDYYRPIPAQRSYNEGRNLSDKNQNQLKWNASAGFYIPQKWRQNQKEGPQFDISNTLHYSELQKQAARQQAQDALKIANQAFEDERLIYSNNGLNSQTQKQQKHNF